MSPRLLILCSLAVWVGMTLIFSSMRWFNRAPLTERLQPYTAGGLTQSQRAGAFSVDSFREVFAPLAATVGEKVARVFGISEELSVRLTRIHSPLDPASFRLRQLGWSTGVFGLAFVLVFVTGLPPAIGLFVVFGGPLLTFLVLEQQVASESSNWQKRIFQELPVVVEQLGMLLGAGFSLGAALNRVAERGNGACSRDLRRVNNRIRQGLSEVEALRERADLADVDELDKVVTILALNREAGDLGRLISEEARTVRREAQRKLVERIERKGQEVWIPVTVATLVPGVMFMAVPFISALDLYT